MDGHSSQSLGGLAYIQNEENRRSIMLPPPFSKRFALVSIPPRDVTQPSTCLDWPAVICDYCFKPHHTRATYWSLHGRPPGVREGCRGRGGRSDGRGGAARVHPSVVPQPLT